MQPVLNVEDVRQVEKKLVRVGVSVSELMHRAGRSVAQEVMRLADTKRVVVLCGTGNNGGDGWVAAETLAQSGLDVCVVTPISPDEIKSDLARVVASSARDAKIPVVIGPSMSELEELLCGADVVVDAMLGTGFHDEPAAPFDMWIDVVNASGARVVCVDVPSGLSAQTGHAQGACVIADMTITMLSLKPGLLSDEGRDVCGAIVVAPLADQTARLVRETDPVAWRSDVSDYVEVLDAPSNAIDKYSRGSVLIVAGSVRFPGAAVMAARAAARAGAGYVKLAVPECIVPVVQTHLLEVPVIGLPCESDGTFSASACNHVRQLAEHARAVVCGPGMCATASTSRIVSTLLSTSVPLVLDADALNCLAQLANDHLENYPELIRRQAPLILTPHRRELGRLVGLSTMPPDSLTTVLDTARRIVWSEGGSELAIVAKGNATACVNVDVALLPKPGPASLATAGSGDVLSGILGALLTRMPANETQNLPLMCALGCEIHGYAGSIAADRMGSRGVMATDIIDAIGLAMDAVEDHATFSGIEA